MTKFGVLMTIKSSPMPPDKQALALIAIRKGFEEAGKQLGCEVECKVIPMPENYTLADLRDYLIACS